MNDRRVNRWIAEHPRETEKLAIECAIKVIREHKSFDDKEDMRIVALDELNRMRRNLMD